MFCLTIYTVLHFHSFGIIFYKKTGTFCMIKAFLLVFYRKN